VSLQVLWLLVGEGLVSIAVPKACLLRCSWRRILRCSAAGACWGCWSDLEVERLELQVRDPGPADCGWRRQNLSRGRVTWWTLHEGGELQGAGLKKAQDWRGGGCHLGCDANKQS
jgi:hypothetical protein